ncbi:WD40 repeat-like protein [Ophidiomyces ophidiicola]|nr:WD40 repeat-like protein [Ophidiomyces ophidiicola]
MLKKLNPLLSNSFLRPVAPQHVCRFGTSTPKDDPFQSGYSAFLERKVLHQQKEQRVAQHVIEQRIHLAKIKHMERYQTREWKTGDVYAPRDLSPGEMRKWRARQSPSIDVFDVLAINPLHLYTNFSIMSDYMSEMGRIKPRPSTTRGQPTQLSVDAKGEKLAYASNKSIFLRSIDDPAVATQYTGHKADTTVARFAPSGYYVASGDSAGIVRVWDCVGEGITKGEYSIINGRINDLAWDGDSQRIIAVGDGKQRYGHCISADSGNTVGEISGHSQSINSVSIRQQRPLRAAAAGDDKTLVFYHGAPFKYNTGHRDNHTNYIYGVAFSPNGEHLISVGGDSRIWLYDGKIGEPKFQFRETEHKGSIFATSWSYDSRKFVTASADRTVKIWDVETQKVIQSWQFGPNNGPATVPNQQVGIVWPSGRSDGLIISLSLSGDLNYLIEGQTKPSKIIHGHQKNITSIVVDSAHSDDTLWTGSYDGRLCSWEVSGGAMKGVQGDGHPGYVVGLVASKESSGRIYSVGWDDTIRSVDISSQSYVGNATKLSAQPKGIASGENAVLIASAQRVDIIRGGDKIGEFRSRAALSAIAAIDHSAALGAEDSTVQFCKIAGGSLEPKADGRVSRNPVTAMAFSPDGTLLAAGDSRGKIVVFKAVDGTIVTDRWTAHTGRITSLAWNKKGTQLVSGGLDTNIFVWSLDRPGDWLEAPNAHKEGVNAVGWVEKGAKIVSAGADGAVKLWQVEF